MQNVVYVLGRDHSNTQNNDTAYRRAGFKGKFVDILYTVSTETWNNFVRIKHPFLVSKKIPFFFSRKNIA